MNVENELFKEIGRILTNNKSDVWRGVAITELIDKHYIPRIDTVLVLVRELFRQHDYLS